MKFTIIAAALAIALAACGSSKPEAAPGSQTMKNACDVFTPDIAKQLLGPAAKLTRKAQPNPHMTQCQYESKTAAITLMVGDRWDFINTGQENVPGEKPLSGLGDEAHINPTSLRVRKGTLGMDITANTAFGEFSGAAADQLQAKDEAFAVKAARALLPNL